MDKKKPKPKPKKPIRKKTMGISLSIVNASSIISDTEAAAVTAALQLQVTNDFYPVWGINAKLTFVPKGKTAVASDWELVILDNSDVAGALGYHDITPAGEPLGKIFAATDKLYGLQWSVTASHELLEMLLDPWVNLSVFNQSGPKAGRIYAYEVCDACESDDFAYTINNVPVSDFVYPAWFEGWRATGSTQFDFKKHIKGPFQLLKGGYISYFDVRNGGGWKQELAEGVPGTKGRAQVGSRRERRWVGQDNWSVSTV